MALSGIQTVQFRPGLCQGWAWDAFIWLSETGDGHHVSITRDLSIWTAISFWMFKSGISLFLAYLGFWILNQKPWKTFKQTPECRTSLLPWQRQTFLPSCSSSSRLEESLRAEWSNMISLTWNKFAFKAFQTYQSMCRTFRAFAIKTLQQMSL